MELNVAAPNGSDRLFLIYFLLFCLGSWTAATNCPTGTFGWQCKYNCACDIACDRMTGHCEHCPGTSWGPGCLLDSSCKYNDGRGINYQGKQSTNDAGHTCIQWEPKRGPYGPDGFPEKDLKKASNYCRNPTGDNVGHARFLWCYHNENMGDYWGYCKDTVPNCPCPAGRFGINCVSECHCRDESNICGSNDGICQDGCHEYFEGDTCQDCVDNRFGVHCEKECHCRDPDEVCNKMTGHCPSGCSDDFTGDDCQECVDNRFGVNCDKVCHCQDSSEVCDKATGHCASGCSAGWTGEDCQTECKQGQYGIYCAGVCSENCDPPGQCNKITGHCPCQAGYQPPLCADACSSETFGWQCKYTCSCETTCDRMTGYCEKCPAMSWGPGCLLASSCRYNDWIGNHYQGKQSTNNAAAACILWQDNTGYAPEDFPDGDLKKVSNYCRNPKEAGGGYSRFLWCYHDQALGDHWSYCTNDVKTCPCPAGRFGINCLSECHCSDENNTCDSNNGICQDGCHKYFEGNACQVCVDNRFGRHCDRTCHCREAIDICDKTTGYCSSGCSAGWTGDDCQTVCGEGQYGINCTGNCSGHCVTPGECDKQTGICACQTGYQPPHCVDVCEEGQYGINCTSNCSENCEPPRQCDRISGICVCQAGYKPPMCVNECEQGKYGLNCTGSCSDHCDPPGLCDKISGTCVCQAGYKPPLCVDECEEGKYGINCTDTCSEHCDSPGECNKQTGICVCQAGYQPPLCVDECQQGQYGINCTGNCSEYCDTPGQCEKISGTCVCQAGYQPPLCFDECEQGQYGMNCSGNCSEYCEMPGDCDKWSGTCMCQAGYIPPFCVDECDSGKYGVNCTGNCSEHCDTPGECDKQSGICVCQAGYQPPVCVNKCEQGQYGLNCSSNCSEHCETPGQCDKSSGTCVCQVGYQPPLCDVECEQGKYGFNCTGNCSENCDTPKQCDKVSGVCVCQAGYQPPICVDECEQGHYGVNCSSNCSEHCDTPRQCDKRFGTCVCQAGYQPPLCFDECRQGEYGLNCSGKCSMNCQTQGRCNSHLGMCLCQAGYLPPFCVEECEKGTYGMNCTNTCSTGCEDECKSADGTCSCKDGFMSNKCEQVCESGKYGKNCLEECSEGCQNTTCNATGHCACRTNYIGDRCERSYVSRHSGPGDVNTEAIAGGTVGSLMIIAVVVVILIWFRRRDGLPGASRRKGTTDEEMVDINHGEINPTGRSGKHDSSLQDYIKYMLDKEQGYEDEYKSIPLEPTGNCDIGNLPGNRPKNRFKNIIPYNHNRVKLHECGDSPVQGYINASFVPGYDDSVNFIAAQGPVPDTLNDFVLMLWENNVPLVVMLTSLKEKNKVKCERYWPNGKQSVPFGQITMTLRKTRQLKNNTHYITRDLVLQKDGTTMNVKHMQFTSWPDHGSPHSPAAFLSFHKEAEKYYQSSRGPVLVHCSAGVGRTGTFLAMDYLRRQAKTEGNISIYNCVLELRKHRVNMVQSLDQYKFLHEALLEALHCGKVVYDAGEFEAWLNQDNSVLLQKQFMMLEKFRHTPRPEDTSAGKDPSNKDKNRSMDLLPLDRSRPLLMMKVPSTTDYINGVFVKASWSNDGILVTQSPLENTVVDLWRLIYDYECHTIVALNTFDSKDYPRYVPSDSDMYGPFNVTVNSTSEEDGFIKTSFTYTIKQEEMKLVHMAVLQEAAAGALPDIAPFLAIIQAMQSGRQDGITGRTLVHCRNGLVESGLFCALSQICHKIKEEGEVDVFHAVKQIRNSRPEFITSLEEYTWLHEAACHNVRSFSTYANFR